MINNMIVTHLHLCTVLCLFTVVPFVIVVVTGDDDFDNVLSARVSKLAIRGAAIAYFDQSTMTNPVTRGYGHLSSSPSSSLVTPDTAFMLASVSKPFAASAVAVLVDRGIIHSIDDDICNVFETPLTDKDYRMCRNPKYPNDKITWRMLLTHRSSMKGNLPSTKNSSGKPISPSYGPLGGYTSDQPAAGNPTCPLDEVVDFYRALLTDDAPTTTVGEGVVVGGKPLNWYQLAQTKGGMWGNDRPGSKNRYSNAAYGYLAGLVELATGQAFSDFCRDNLFGPLGMDRTTWFREDLRPGGMEDSNVAIPVEKKRRGGFVDIGHYCFIDYASGQLYTSANDLAKWGHAMLHYGAPTLWSEGVGRNVVSCQEQDTSQKPIGNGCEYGYGWTLLDNSMKKQSSTESWLKEGFQKYDWTDGVWHDGAEAGSQTNIIILPKAGLYVAVLTNTDLNSETAAQQLTRAIVEAPLPSMTITPPTKPPPTLAPSRLPTPQPTSQKCPGKSEFVFSITTDRFPRETRWILKRNNKRFLRKTRYNTYKKSFTSYQESICIPSRGKYTFRIYDRNKDGICCGAGSGNYEISVNGIVKKKGGRFQRRETTIWRL